MRRRCSGSIHPVAAGDAAIADYAASLGVPANPALSALGRARLDYHAIALDAEGKPVPIIHSDEGFALLFTDPAPADLDLMVESVMRPFPAGLMTDVGMVVANAALANDALKADFTPAKYHGAVVWSWQQALFAAGLERQLKRTDLPSATRTRLTRAQADLWRVIKAATRVQEFGAVVVDLCRRTLSGCAVWRRAAGCGRIQRRPAVEHCLSRGAAP